MSRTIPVKRNSVNIRLPTQEDCKNLASHHPNGEGWYPHDRHQAMAVIIDENDFDLPPVNERELNVDGTGKCPPLRPRLNLGRPPTAILLRGSHRLGTYPIWNRQIEKACNELLVKIGNSTSESDKQQWTQHHDVLRARQEQFRCPVFAVYSVDLIKEKAFKHIALAAAENILHTQKADPIEIVFANVASVIEPGMPFADMTALIQERLKRGRANVTRETNTFINEIVNNGVAPHALMPLLFLRFQSIQTFTGNVYTNDSLMAPGWFNEVYGASSDLMTSVLVHGYQQLIALAAPGGLDLSDLPKKYDVALPDPKEKCVAKKENELWTTFCRIGEENQIDEHIFPDEAVVDRFMEISGRAFDAHFKEVLFKEFDPSAAPNLKTYMNAHKAMVKQISTELSEKIELHTKATVTDEDKRPWLMKNLYQRWMYIQTNGLMTSARFSPYGLPIVLPPSPSLIHGLQRIMVHALEGFWMAARTLDPCATTIRIQRSNIFIPNEGRVGQPRDGWPVYTSATGIIPLIYGLGPNDIHPRHMLEKQWIAKHETEACVLHHVTGALSNVAMACKQDAQMYKQVVPKLKGNIDKTSDAAKDILSYNGTTVQSKKKKKYETVLTDWHTRFLLQIKNDIVTQKGVDVLRDAFQKPPALNISSKDKMKYKSTIQATVGALAYTRVIINANYSASHSHRGIETWVAHGLSAAFFKAWAIKHLFLIPGMWEFRCKLGAVVSACMRQMGANEFTFFDDLEQAPQPQMKTAFDEELFSSAATKEFAMNVRKLNELLVKLTTIHAPLRDENEDEDPDAEGDKDPDVQIGEPSSSKAGLPDQGVPEFLLPMFENVNKVVGQAFLFQEQVNADPTHLPSIARWKNIDVMKISSHFEDWPSFVTPTRADFLSTTRYAAMYSFNVADCDAPAELIDRPDRNQKRLEAREENDAKIVAPKAALKGSSRKLQGADLSVKREDKTLAFEAEPVSLLELIKRTGKKKSSGFQPVLDSGDEGSDSEDAEEETVLIESEDDKDEAHIDSDRESGTDDDMEEELGTKDLLLPGSITPSGKRKSPAVRSDDGESERGSTDSGKEHRAKRPRRDSTLSVDMMQDDMRLTDAMEPSAGASSQPVPSSQSQDDEGLDWPESQNTTYRAVVEAMKDFDIDLENYNFEVEDRPKTPLVHTEESLSRRAAYFKYRLDSEVTHTQKMYFMNQLVTTLEDLQKLH
ncbi:hypothetical protein FISHEDRAFT_73164 [Fistulina hepatica ATCC 64428]|uniref:Uncharacterized protein n=1 Tax=Fistulina hepatica ATCC 64428 TaxID=1128425 RepID=A0A0D7ADZ1_9AGAR|nr:hypothetical protein FISHEDRAFT_73164 [Fistulina hepatica ATCC 64428]